MRHARATGSGHTSRLLPTCALFVPISGKPEIGGRPGRKLDPRIHQEKQVSFHEDGLPGQARQ
jgi:hypothetical protein